MPDLRVDVLPRLDPDGRRVLVRLVERAARERGVPPLGDPALAELAGSTTESGTLAIVATRDRTARPVGYAHLDPPAVPQADGTWTVEVAVDPDAGPDGPTALLRAAVAEVGRRGGTNLRWWCPGATAEDVAVAATLGFSPERTLLQLRCPLPLADDGTGVPPPTFTRSFRPGQDEDPWLRTNNRAFAGHPEQGAWDRATLQAREREPWFDADGFRVLDEDGAITGFCWTKIHAHTDPPLGEIYVIGVDPDAHGRGLGRALVRDGLGWLAGRGIRTGMLYVDAANGAALQLYRSLGFTEHHADRAFVLGPDERIPR